MFIKMNVTVKVLMILSWNLLKKLLTKPIKELLPILKNLTELSKISLKLLLSEPKELMI